MDDETDVDLAEILDDLNSRDVSELRTLVYTIGREGPEPHPPYEHQLEGILRIEAGAKKHPPVSGILHCPTGAGKTRTALEVIARTLTDNPEHRFIWATASRNLIRQAMVRLVELARIFPQDTSLAWIRDAEHLEELGLDGDEVRVAFMTRHTLTAALERAADARRRSHPWREHLERRLPLTLVYDECHQLGAAKLQRNLLKFYESVVSPPRAWRRPFRVIGLSATPVPSREDAHRLLGECVFPPRRDTPSTAHGWPFHVFQRVPNTTLVERGVLCPLNLSLDHSGYFDIPADLLKSVTGAMNLIPPGPNADPLAVQEYSLTFNTRVMGDPSVVAFLAERLGSRLPVLGKTIVFTPSIDTANRLAAHLHEQFPALRGCVAAVHSRMADVQVAGQDRATVQAVLQEFRERGSKPSILINVDMLTEGFDDPKIQTVVLARLTLSTNRFWQMIGRGARGPACEGTNDCNVIDPVKLVRLYDYFGGYQPAFEGGASIENEGAKPPELGLDSLSPEIPVVHRPPDPVACTYLVDPSLAKIHQQVAAALADFLHPISEALAVEVARHARLDLSEGRPVMKLSAADVHFDHQSAMAILMGQIGGLEQRTGHDLGWFRRWLPHPVDEVILRNQLRRLHAIEQLGLWTPSDFARAEMSGAFQSLMGNEVVLTTAGNDASSHVSIASAGEFSVPLPLAKDELTLTAAELATLQAAAAIIRAGTAERQATLSYAQGLIVMDTLRRLFGRTPSDAMEKAILASFGGASTLENGSLKELSVERRQALLAQLAHLAMVDNVISEAEQGILDRIASELEISPAMTRAILGGDDTGASSEQSESGIICRSCSFDLPLGACFCPGCGIAVAAGYG